MSTPRRWKNLNDSSISLTTRLTMLTTRLASLTPVSLHAATDGQQGGVDRRRRMEAAGPDASPNVEGVPARPDGDVASHRRFAGVALGRSPLHHQVGRRQRQAPVVEQAA